MSNYYVSNCCGAEVSEIDIKSNTGRCLDCKEMCELEAVIDND